MHHLTTIHELDQPTVDKTRSVAAGLLLHCGRLVSTCIKISSFSK